MQNKILRLHVFSPTISKTPRCEHQGSLASASTSTIMEAKQVSHVSWPWTRGSPAAGWTRPRRTAPGAEREGGEASLTMAHSTSLEKSQQNWMRWQVLGLKSTVCRTMAASSKSHYNHINEINQWISSSQMSGRQGRIQPRLVINFFFGGGRGKSTILPPSFLSSWQFSFTNLKTTCTDQKARKAESFIL